MLPSQNARPTASRAHMYRRGKNRSLIAIIGGGLCIVISIFVVRWVIGGSGGDGQIEPSNDGSSTSSVAQSDGESTMHQPASTPRSSASDRGESPEHSKPAEPVKIAMGSSLPADLGSSSDPSASQSQRQAQPSTPSTQPSTPRASPPAAVALEMMPNAPSSPTQQPASQSPSAPTHVQGRPGSPQTTTEPVSQRVQLGLDLIKQNKPVEARKVLSEALVSSGVSSSEAERIRTELGALNQRLVFSPEVVPGDPFTAVHQIAPGESLARIERSLKLPVDWRFIARINQIADPSRIRAGQRIKIIKAPFHAVIDKRTFRLDLYLGDGTDRVYVRSFVVGLGEYGTTPEGAFVVKNDSRVINPSWTNPRTGEFFKSDDPKNPVGEYWIGLLGASENIRGLETYGIHGTIDPDSIGKEMSMGCVRLRDDDIALIYEVITERGSRVEVHGSDWP